MDTQLGSLQVAPATVSGEQAPAVAGSGVWLGSSAATAQPVHALCDLVCQALTP